RVYRVGRCKQCGLGYLNPRPDRDSIGHYYPENYEEYHGRSEYRPGCWGRLRRYLERLVMARHYGCPPPLRHGYERLLAEVAAPWLRPARDALTGLRYHGRGRLLEFGCGWGWYAHRMRERGWHVTGLDVSAHAAEMARRTFDLPVLVGSLPHPDVKPETFDVITMGAVLEHVHDPHAVVGAAAQALAPGGLLVVVVPNVDSWGFRFFGQDWWPLELPRHLLHFTPGTLRRLVESNGLRVQELTMVDRGGWMR